MHSAATDLSGESAKEIQQRFDTTLEREYAQSVLMSNRTLIRITNTTIVAYVLLRIVEQSMFGQINAMHSLGLVVTAVGFGTLAVLAWGRCFPRLYRTFANALVPLLNVIIGGTIAFAASAGSMEGLMTLPLSIVACFFFFGLSIRPAVLSGVAAVLAFAVGAAALHTEPLVLWRAGSITMITLFACAIAAREQEIWSRRSFLAARLVVRLAQQDALTGLQNRRVFDERLTQWWARAIEENRRMAILLIDVDHFKAYNDRHGHQAGDHTLRTVADALSTFADRPDDLLARYGGEEFAAILYDVDESYARHTAECMRVAVAQANITHRGSQCAERITVSIGVGFVTPTPGRTAEGLLQLADQALYDAKIKGRNQIVVMNEDDYRMLVTGIFRKKPARAG